MRSFLVTLAVVALLCSPALADRLAARTLQQNKPVAPGDCAIVNVLAKPRFEKRGICFAQKVKGKDGQATVVEPTKVADIQASAAAACAKLGYTSANLVASSWTSKLPAAMKQCYNGVGNVAASTVWASLQCCGKSSLARLQVEDQPSDGLGP